ncbi:MAG TPA: DUF5947 family protein [Opitutaceae bacterium]|nr:DUF5947 family protein [Opitutaceae bacterium]
MIAPGADVSAQVNPRIGALRRFTARRTRGQDGTEQCELCSLGIPGQHRHLLEPGARKILCACDACALRFEGVIGGRFALVPRDARRLDDFRLSDEQWAAFALPIDLAFFFRSSQAERVVALYPSPAGAVESLLTFQDWENLQRENPVLAGMVPDVEALLVDRRSAGHVHYLAPIDACYQLVGLIRRHWTGLSGGADVWQEVSGFFARLDPRPKNLSNPALGLHHA